MPESRLPQEIGGYFEFERFSGKLFHDEAIAVNSGRNALAYLFESQSIERILLPDYLCDAVDKVCHLYNVSVRRYAVGANLRPVEEVHLEDGEWLYLVNYFGQLKQTELASYSSRYQRLILDHAQAYFSAPPDGVPTVYTCRKYFGVPDGGFVRTSQPLTHKLEAAESHKQFQHILGRFECTASEFYELNKQNEASVDDQPLLAMSPLTSNLLRAVDYPRVIQAREDNFSVLSQRLGGLNELSITFAPGPYAYPLLISSGSEIRQKLHQAQAYVATLWPNVLREELEQSAAYYLAANLLPLPVDHRYSTEQMHQLANLVEELINELH